MTTPDYPEDKHLYQYCILIYELRDFYKSILFIILYKTNEDGINGRYVFFIRLCAII